MGGMEREMTIDKLAKELWCVENGIKEYPYKTISPWRLVLATHVQKQIEIAGLRARVDEIEQMRIMKIGSWDFKELGYRYDERIAELNQKIKEVE